MLDVNGIDLRYGAALALRGIKLAAEPGEVTCVLGRNGVGKTSLLRALTGHHPVSGGTIRFDGADITRMKPFERARRGIAYVPQGREIFPLLTVEENLKTGFAPLKREDRTIPDDVFALFPVLNSMLGRCGGDLSGGQQQQLAIGRAIAYLRNLGQIATVLVEQYLDFALELGDYFAVMDRGTVVYSCTREAMDEGALRRAMAI